MMIKVLQVSAILIVLVMIFAVRTYERLDRLKFQMERHWRLVQKLFGEWAETTEHLFAEDSGIRELARAFRGARRLREKILLADRLFEETYGLCREPAAVSVEQCPGWSRKRHLEEELTSYVRFHNELAKGFNRALESERYRLAARVFRVRPFPHFKSWGQAQKE